MAGINWRGDEFMREMRKEIDKRLSTCGEVVRAAVVSSMDTSGRSIGAAAKWGIGPIRSREKMRVGGKKSVYIFRSRPGEVPLVQTGMLKKSIFWTLTGNNSVIVGTPLKYGKYLEKGTPHMDPRPYLLPALVASIWKIQGIIKKPFRFR
jgi:hypothetical protein